MNQTLTQIQEEFDRDCPWLGSTYEQDAKNRKWVSDFLTQSNLRVLEKVNKEWMSLNLRNDNKENWDKELAKFGVFMQGLSTLIEQK